MKKVNFLIVFAFFLLVLGNKVYAQEVQYSAETSNKLSTSYSRYGKPIGSYLCDNKDGTMTRVEYANYKLRIETYNASDGSFVEGETMACELPEWGGFYEGTDYYFFVFGQTNEEEDDNKEVLRVVRYTKDWERVDACSIYGALTKYPFQAGSLRMLQVGDVLYIHTCHGMYVDHQANMTFCIDIPTMTTNFERYLVSNLRSGYSSHSFNQFIVSDGRNIITADHGDGLPRSVVLVKYADASGTSLKSKRVSFTHALPIQGTLGNNATGLSLGGLEAATSTYLTTGCSVDQSNPDSFDASGVRNIFVTVTDSADFYNQQDQTDDYTIGNSKLVWLTDFDSGDGVTVSVPHMVKLNADSFLILWMENDVLKYVTIDGNGNRTSQVYTNPYAMLSDCKPTFVDGSITWYTTYRFKPVFYKIDVNDLENLSIYTNNEISDCEISISQDLFMYTGTERKPDVTVKYGKRMLVLDKDYQLTYHNNVQPGIGTVTVTGIGSYKGSVEKQFEILKEGYLQGACGEDAMYILDTDGTLLISGTGEMTKEFPALLGERAASVKKVVVEEGITTIYDSAFRGMTGIEEVVLPKSLYKIYGYAFYGCTKITEIVIPEAVEGIFNYAFYGCTSLQNLVIPEGTQSFGPSIVRSSSTMLWVLPNTRAEYYAKNNGLKYCSTQKVFLDTTELEIPLVGEEYTLNAEIQMFNGEMNESATPTWTSDNHSVVTVSPDGIITAKGVGSAVVTAQYEQREAACVVTVSHDISTHVDKKEPTCEEVGNKEYWKCSDCGKTYSDARGILELSDIEIPSKGHSPESVEGEEATCVLAGHTEGTKCSVCEKTLSGIETIAAKGHSWDEGTVIEEPTSEKDGIIQYACLECDATYDRILLPDGTGGEIICQHNTVTILDSVPVTCEDTGLTQGKVCSDCGMVLEEQEVIPALGHNMVTGDVIEEPTAHKVGKQEEYCTRCGKTQTIVLPATGEENSEQPDEENQQTEQEQDNLHDKPDDSQQTTQPGIITKDEHDPSVNTKPVENIQPVGTIITNNQSRYRVVKAENIPSVTYIKSIGNHAKTVNVPTQIVENGVHYQVVAIGNYAFKNNKKLKKIVIPASVNTIGKKVFAGCKNLRTIIIKSDKLTSKSIHKSAFKGVSSKVVIKVPKKKVKEYTKLFRKKGLNKKVKIKKIL